MTDIPYFKPGSKVRLKESVFVTLGSIDHREVRRKIPYPVIYHPATRSLVGFTIPAGTPVRISASKRNLPCWSLGGPAHYVYMSGIHLYLLSSHFTH